MQAGCQGRSRSRVSAAGRSCCSLPNPLRTGGLRLSRAPAEFTGPPSLTNSPRVSATRPLELPSPCPRPVGAAPRIVHVGAGGHGQRDGPPRPLLAAGLDCGRPAAQGQRHQDLRQADQPCRQVGRPPPWQPLPRPPPQWLPPALLGSLAAYQNPHAHDCRPRSAPAGTG